MLLARMSDFIAGFRPQPIPNIPADLHSHAGAEAAAVVAHRPIPAVLSCSDVQLFAFGFVL